MTGGPTRKRRALPTGLHGILWLHVSAAWQRGEPVTGRMLAAFWNLHVKGAGCEAVVDGDREPVST